jgi:F-type H+-transporting ATPase subunit b
MQEILTNMASAGTAETVEKDFFSVLGIDWQLLIIQTVAFLVLLWFLAKFVYPPLTRMLEKRDEAIEAGVRAASEAEKKAASAQEETAKLLKKARKEASEIVATAKDEAAATAASADAKAKERTERLIADAHAQVEKDVVAARKALHNETIELVAMATEKVIGKTINAKVDGDIIASSVKDVR